MSAPTTVPALTVEDIDSIIDGIENFIQDGNPEVDAIWQPYIDQLTAQRDQIGALPEMLDAGTAFLGRIFEVYRPEYVEGAAAREPRSLLGCAKRLEAAVAKAKGQPIAPHESARPCGCDPGAHWTCEAHRSAVPT